MWALRRLGFWAPRLLPKSFLSLIRALVKGLCRARSIMSWDPWGFMSVVCDAPKGEVGSGPGGCSMYGKKERERWGEKVYVGV